MISVLLPARDELASLPLLLAEILAGVPGPLEIVIADDGSTDGTSRWLDTQPGIRHVSLPGRCGKSAALCAALDLSRGDPVLLMDADLQNVPAEAPLLLDALAGRGMACGVRRTRVATAGKRAASRVWNAVRRRVLRDRFRDTGCGFLAMRREVALALPRFRGMHRFLPVLAESLGYEVAEVLVTDRARRFGRSHYDNARRAVHGLFDLVRVARLRRRLAAQQRIHRQAHDDVRPFVEPRPLAEPRFDDEPLGGDGLGVARE